MKKNRAVSNPMLYAMGCSYWLYMAIRKTAGIKYRNPDFPPAARMIRRVAMQISRVVPVISSAPIQG